ncbi:MAG TPA: TonB family protein [Candidatus Polarisedimenticolia bacterium]|nr:TonB family protein [Candidatus Polarisedimenticolia bacterium]
MGIHLVLVVVLFVGPAFLSNSSRDATPPLNFIAAQTVDAAISGGGDNSVKSPPAELTAPPVPVAPPAQVAPSAPVPPPVAERTPPPVEKTSAPTPRERPREVKPPKNDTPVVEAKPRTHKIEVSTKLVMNSSADVKAARDAARKAAAAEKRRADAALGRAIAGIKGGVAGSTEVKLKGPGGGGIPYANFASAVRTVYYNAWRQPDGVPEVSAEVSVTIARDGTVVSAHIVTPSGNSTVDNSVQETIDRVKFAAPLPESATEDQREVLIKFTIQSTTTG